MPGRESSSVSEAVLRLTSEPVAELVGAVVATAVSREAVGFVATAAGVGDDVDVDVTADAGCCLRATRSCSKPSSDCCKLEISVEIGLRAVWMERLTNLTAERWIIKTAEVSIEISINAGTIYLAFIIPFCPSQDELTIIPTAAWHRLFINRSKFVGLPLILNSF